MDYEVVDDSLRQKYPHRGRPTPPHIEALMEGKTLRLPRIGGCKDAAKRYGYICHFYTAKDEAGGLIVWFTKVQP